jgi:hypothetical protein
MAIHIGEYIREEVRKQEFSDQEVASYLNISKSAVEKIYMRDEIYASRIEKFCALLKKDMFAFYYQKEPLKGIHQNSIEKLEKEIEALKKTIDEKDEIIADKKNIIDFLKQTTTSSQAPSTESSVTRKSKSDRKK